MKKPEIVATLGYSFIKNSELIEKLLQEGVFNFRFNLCKGEDVSLLKQKIELIRDVEKKYDYPINIMLDIPFPGKKPRIFLENTDKIHVEKGEHLLITSPSVEPKNKKLKRIVIDVEHLEKKVDKTRNIVYSDGECTFDIVRYVEENIIEVKANESHTIYDSKSLSIGHIEKRERLPQDILELISNVKFDSIALSFVTNSKEVKYFKSLFPQVNIISKIECPQGIAEVEKISKISDVMLGRGDLCLTSDCFNLYCYQKKIAKICKKNRCKFYVATGILSSLCKQSIPSQADIIDVSNLLLLSPDFIVLNFPLIYSKHNLALKTIENIFQRVV